MRPVFISRTAAFLPGAPVDNDSMEAVLGQAGGRPSRARRTILRSNGIKSRHYAIDPATGRSTHTNAALTAEAIRALGVGADIPSIDVLACGTSIADQLMPNHAVMVQGELGLPSLEVAATSGVCMAGLTALRYAALAVAAGAERGVATGSETASAVMRAENFAAELDTAAEDVERRPELAFEKDFLRWMLSDGAGAVLIEPAPRAGFPALRIDWIEIFSYAGEMEACMYAGAVKEESGALTGWPRFSPEDRARQSVMAVKQDVRLLNEEVIRYTMERPLATLPARRGLRMEDVDFFLPHYSSEYFRSRVDEGMKRVNLAVPMERWFSNLTRKGNTGSASIYIILDELLRSGRVEPGHRLLCWVPESGRFSAGFMHLTAV